MMSAFTHPTPIPKSNQIGLTKKYLPRHQLPKASASPLDDGKGDSLKLSPVPFVLRQARREYVYSDCAVMETMDTGGVLIVRSPLDTHTRFPHNVSRWCPLAFLVAFKLDNDPLKLSEKAHDQLERHGLHMVVRIHPANMLTTHSPARQHTDRHNHHHPTPHRWATPCGPAGDACCSSRSARTSTSSRRGNGSWSRP